MAERDARGRARARPRASAGPASSPRRLPLLSPTHASRRCTTSPSSQCRAARPETRPSRSFARCGRGSASRTRRRPSRRDEPGHRRLRRHARGAARVEAHRRGARRRSGRMRTPRGRAPAHGDGRTHVAAAGGADDVRPQGGRLARRARGVHGAASPRSRSRCRRSSAAQRERSLRSATTGSEVLRLYAEELGLREPTVPWHTIRTPVAELAGALAGAAGAAAKIAARHRVAGADRGGRGRRACSRADPRRCPTSATPSGPCSPSRANVTRARTPAILLEGVVQEHERAAGAWQAEWHALTTRARRDGRRGRRRAPVAHRPRGRRRPHAREHRRRRRSPRQRRLGIPAEAARGLSRLGRCVRRPCARAASRMSGTVVLCGSLGSAATIWDPQIPALAGRRVVRVDYPGHGDAPLAEVQEVGDLAARVLDARRRRAPSRSSVSRSAERSACSWRCTAPERVERLVLACTAARFGDPAQWLDRAALVRAEGLEPIVDAVLARWFTPQFAGRRRVSRACCSRSIRRATRVAATRSRAGTSATRCRPSARPTLVIAGADDPSTPPGTVEAIAAEIPGARFEVIDRRRPHRKRGAGRSCSTD